MVPFRPPPSFDQRRDVSWFAAAFLKSSVEALGNAEAREAIRQDEERKRIRSEYGKTLEECERVEQKDVSLGEDNDWDEDEEASEEEEEGCIARHDERVLGAGKCGFNTATSENETESATYEQRMHQGLKKCP